MAPEDDDGSNWWRFRELLWTLRWLAAEPDAAIAAAPKYCVVDEIATDIEHWMMVARGWDLVDPSVLARIEEIDREFAAMFEANWTDNHRDEDRVLLSSPAWARQRDRAREVLALMGEERADSELETPRWGTMDDPERSANSS